MVTNLRRLNGVGALMFGGLLAAALALAPPASAESKREQERAKAAAAKKDEKKRDPIDERMQKKLLEIYELIEQEKWKEVTARLDALDEKRLGNFGRAITYQLRGGLAAMDEKFEKSAEWYKKALAEDAFGGQQETGLRFQLGQVYTVLRRWEDAIQLLEKVIEQSESPNGEANFRIALAYYQRGAEKENANDMKLAVAAAQKAVDIGAEKPKEAWLRLLMALRWDQKEYAQCVPLLQKLVIFYPKKDWWVRLAAIYGEMDRDDDAMLAMQLADFGDYLEVDADVRRVVQMHVASGMPYNAAVRLERGIEQKVINDELKTWELLGSCWLAAREPKRALAPLTKAAEMSDDGDAWLRVARVHAQKEEWDAAIAAIQNALEKGKVDKPGQALLIEGFAQYGKKAYDEAKRTFERARGHATEAETADKWLLTVEAAVKAQAVREEARKAMAEMRSQRAGG